MFGSVGLNGMSLTDQLYLAQSNIIREMAEDSSCVVVGRCADHVLRDFPNKFDFFIHGSIEDRVKRIQTCGDYEIEGKTPEAALEKMDKTALYILQLLHRQGMGQVRSLRSVCQCGPFGRRVFDGYYSGVCQPSEEIAFWLGREKREKKERPCPMDTAFRIFLVRKQSPERKVICVTLSQKKAAIWDILRSKKERS